MKYELLSNLGMSDARRCNADFGASLSLDPEHLTAGTVVDLPDAAAAYLTGPKSKGGRGYVSLLKPASKVHGVAKQSEVTAPAK
jgi:hypothetical protein